MIEGAVNENLEATIRLALLGADRKVREVEAIIDTGFTGYLTLPTALIRLLNLSWKGRGQALIADGSLHVFDEYIGQVLWNGQDRPVEVAAADITPLVGMGLLMRHSLRVEVVARGEVRIEPLA